MTPRALLAPARLAGQSVLRTQTDERLLDLVADGSESAFEALDDLITAVQSLPLRQRDAIVLRELEGRSYDEIADELGVTHGAVRALLNRARTTIRASVTA